MQMLDIDDKFFSSLPRISLLRCDCYLLYDLLIIRNVFDNVCDQFPYALSISF